MKKGASLVLLFLIFGIFLVGSFGDVIATCGVVAGSSYFSDLVSVPTTCTTTGYCLMPNCYNANHGGYSSFQACASVCGGSCWGCPSGCGSNNVDCTCSSDCSNSCLLNCHASNSFPCTQTQTVYYCDSSCTRQCNPNTLGDCATSCCTPSIDASYYLNQNICGNDLSNGCTNSLNVNCLSGSCNYPFSDLDLSLSYRNFTGCSFTVGDASSPCFLFTNPTIRLANPWRGTNYFLNFTTFQNLSSITVSWGNPAMCNLIPPSPSLLDGGLSCPNVSVKFGNILIYNGSILSADSQTFINPTPSLVKNITLSFQYMLDLSDIKFFHQVQSSSGTCTQMGATYWANLNGVPINHAEVNDTVGMMVGGAGFTQNINYSVYKPLGFWFSKFVIPLSISLSSLSWSFNETLTNIYFKARLGNLENISSKINISGYDDANPIAIISSPLRGYVFLVGHIINFSHLSSDEDDLLNITWNFGDGASYFVTNYSINFTYGLGNTIHNYSTNGVKLVTLTAREMVRGQSDQDSVLVHIFKPGINVLANISKPLNGQNAGNDIVGFNIDQSYVVNCSTALTSYNFTVDGLRCLYIHSPGQKTTIGYNLTVKWNFDGQILVGNWSSNYNVTVNFTRLYLTAGNYNALVNLTYGHGTTLESDYDMVNFFANGGWICQSGADTALWKHQGLSDINAVNNCSLYSDTGYGCCPVNNASCGDDGKCYGGRKTLCSEFDTQNSCGNASFEIANNSMRYVDPNILCSVSLYGANNCQYVDSCSCKWANGNCTAGSIRTNCTGNTSGACYFNTLVDNKCDKPENSLTYFFKVDPILSTGASCTESSRVLSCAQTEGELPFFGITNFIIVLVSVGLVYFISTRKKSKVRRG